MGSVGQDTIHLLLQMCILVIFILFITDELTKMQIYYDCLYIKIFSRPVMGSKDFKPKSTSIRQLDPQNHY